MVGHPKTLHDLRRVEAAVQVTCRTCGHVAVLDREEMISDRKHSRRSMEWAAVQHDQICRTAGCTSSDVLVLPLPFGQSMPEVRQRRAMMLAVNLSLQVLEQACRKPPESSRESVRLALRVLHPHVRDETLMLEFWEHAITKRDDIGSHPYLVIRWMVRKLVDRGYAVWAELR